MAARIINVINVLERSFTASFRLVDGIIIAGSENGAQQLISPFYHLGHAAIIRSPGAFLCK
jgi:hypothetical protein